MHLYKRITLGKHEIRIFKGVSLGEHINQLHPWYYFIVTIPSERKTLYRSEYLNQPPVIQEYGG